MNKLRGNIIILMIISVILMLVSCVSLNEPPPVTDDSFIPEAPILNISGGTFPGGEEVIVEISNPNNEGDIYYTLDGTLPGKHSYKYSGPVVLLGEDRKTAALLAVVIADNGNVSSYSSGFYEQTVIFKDSAVQKALEDYFSVEAGGIKYSMLNKITSFFAYGDYVSVNDEFSIIKDIGYSPMSRTFQDGFGKPESRGGIVYLDDFNLMSGLTELSVNFNKVESIPDLSNLTLEKVCLEDNYITNVSGLESQMHMRYVYLNNNMITDARCLGGGRKISIYELSLSENPLEFLPDTKPMIDLTHLYLSDTGITDWPELYDNKELVMLDLSNNGIKQISRPPKALRISKLDFSGNDLTDISNLKYLGETISVKYHDGSITKKAACEVLNLSGNKIADLSPLMEISSLRRLILTDNGCDIDWDILKQMTWLDEIVVE